MTKFYVGAPYWDSCNSCNSIGIHYYKGYQEGFEDIQGFYLGNCGNCNSTKKINLETKTE